MRKNRARSRDIRKIRQAYSQDALARICTLREDRFGRAFGMQTVHVSQPAPYLRYPGDSGRPEDYYHFKDNGARVLAVAHLDTVVAGKRRVPRFRTTENGPLIVSGALDDRLGAYVILDLLPKLGLTCDWLLTVGEESGLSTAEFFKPEKEYDWIIEFDRGGTDVVMYQYEDRASRGLVEASGAAMGSGSFSDIASLEHLNAKAFNWGVGYRGDYHSERGYAYLNDTFAMVGKYLRFHEQNAGTPMPHDPDVWEASDRYSASYGRYSASWAYDGAPGEDCWICNEPGAVDPVTRYCRVCGACDDCYELEDSCQCYTPAGLARRAEDEAARAEDGGSSGRRENGSRPPFPGTPDQVSWGQYLAKRYPDSSTGPGTISGQIVFDVGQAKENGRKKAREKSAQLTDAPGDPEHWHAEQGCQGCIRCGEWTFGQHIITAHYADEPVVGCIQCGEDGQPYEGEPVNLHEPAASLIPGTPPVVRHRASRAWAGVCTRCAARWPQLELTTAE